MGIIVEGADNSGKTTLVNDLSRRLMVPAFHAGGPPGSDAIALRLCAEQLTQCDSPCILDRVTPISRQIYENRMGDDNLNQYLKRMLDHKFAIVIYCRPPNEKLMDLSNHKVRPEESDEHIKYVTENQQHFIKSYDRLMSKIPHISYDWTKETDFDTLAKHLYMTQYTANYKHNITLSESLFRGSL